MNNKKIIYLSGAMGCYGNLSEYPYIWRAMFEKILKDYLFNIDRDIYEEFEIFDPTMFYDYQEELQYTEKEVFRYEMRQVENSDILVVNLKDVDKSIGTVCEVVNAYINNIPIIGFCSDEEIYVNIHPWITEMCDRIEFEANDECAMKRIASYILSYY